VSVLAGGYLGETLRELVGGEWVYGVDAGRRRARLSPEASGPEALQWLRCSSE
jgi:hypothetical protein